MQHQVALYDQNILRDFFDIMTPFESAAHCVQGEGVVIGSWACPVYRVREWWWVVGLALCTGWGSSDQ